jgi:hypothetical protein
MSVEEQLHQVKWDLLSHHERQLLDLLQVELSPVSLTFKKDLSQSRMMAIGQILFDLHRRINDEYNFINFALGDWMIEIDRLSGQKDLGVTLATQMSYTPMYSCFISYSNADKAFATKLYEKLHAIGVPIWYAPKDIQGGKKIHQQLHHAISETERLLVVLSDASLRSQWVITEIRKARQLELEGTSPKLFPIRIIPMEKIQKWECFDADTGKDLGVEI